MDAAHTAQRRGTFFGGVGRLATGGREMSTDEGLLRKAALRRRLTAQRKALHPDQVDARGLKVDLVPVDGIGVWLRKPGEALPVAEVQGAGK